MADVGILFLVNTDHNIPALKTLPEKVISNLPGRNSGSGVQTHETVPLLLVFFTSLMTLLKLKVHVYHIVWIDLVTLGTGRTLTCTLAAGIL